MVNNTPIYLVLKLRRERSSLYDFANNLGGFSIRLEELLALLTVLLDGVIFVEELLEEGLLVELRDEAVLHHVLAVIYEEVHDGLGNLVGNGLADNVEIGRNEGPDEVCLHDLTVGQGWFVGFALSLISNSRSKGVPIGDLQSEQLVLFVRALPRTAQAT